MKQKFCEIKIQKQLVLDLVLSGLNILLFSIEKHIMSVTKGKNCIKLAGKNEESEHFERHRGFPDMEYDGKKSMTAIGKIHLTSKILNAKLY